jgi:predicted phosphodiesterase
VAKKLTRERAEELRDKILPTSKTVPEALNRAGERWGWRPNGAYIRAQFAQLFSRPPSAFLGQPCPTPESPEGAGVRSLVTAVRKGRTSLEELCDELGMPPRSVRALAAQAAAEGFSVEVADGGMAFYGPRPRSEPVHIARPTKADTLKFGVISDTHYGSKFCRPHEIAEFVEQAWDEGCQDILHCGDFIDGVKVYKGHEFEVVDASTSGQIDIALDSLPEIDGLNYHFITGNHDESIRKQVGYEPGRMIEDRARAQRRSDIHHLGAERAQVYYGGDDEGEGVLLELMHPGGGQAYALSYKLQKYVESFSGGTKPQVLLVGHFHTYVKLLSRNVFGFQCGGFQSQTPFFAKFGKEPTVGGLILEVDVGDDWSILRMQDSFVPFFMGRLCRD